MFGRVLAPLLAVCLVLAPAAPALAAESKVPVIGPNQMFDGNVTTYYQIDDGESVTVELENGPRIISLIRFLALSNWGGPDLTVRLRIGADDVRWESIVPVDAVGKLWYELRPPEVPGQWIELTLAPTNANWVRIYELEVYEAVYPVPSAPVDLRAVPYHDRVQVTWAPPLDSYVSGYRVYRDGEQIGETADTAFSDDTVAPDTEYCYTVTAYNSSGESTPTQPVCVQTPATPVIPPPEPPTGLQVTPTVAGLRVSWSPSPSGDVVGYRVYLDGDLVFETSETTVTLTDLEPGRTYHVAVTAVAVDGRESPATTGSGEPFDVPQEPPGPVQAARARVGARHVELVWTSPAAGGVATEYQVYRDGVLLGTTTDTRWVDSTVEPDSQYLYVIVAANDLGTSEPVELTVRTPPAGLLEGANPGLSGLGREVGAGIGLLLQPALVAAGLILARIITTRGLRWVGVWRRG